MIDMHSHVLFGVDDGPETIEDTLRILEKAAAEGITDMIATPHAFSPHSMCRVTKSKVKSNC